MATVENKDKVLTTDHVSKIFGKGGTADWHAQIWKACQDKQITKVLRLAAFLAQVKVESGSLAFVVENLNYSASGLLNTFPKYFDQTSAAAYARQPEKIANRVYGSRMGNGNEASGDGWKYRGRGLIQLTGKDNYTKLTQLGVSCLGDNSSYLETKEGAARSAAAFWGMRGLNELADRGDFTEITRRVNGGMKAAAERQAAYELAIRVLTDLSDTTPLDTTPVDPSIPPDPAVKTVTVTPSKTEDPSECHTPQASQMKITEPIVSGQAVYPWNQPFESRSGHLIEIDDTPGVERLHWYHRTGTYTEMQPEGDHVTKSVRDSYHFVNQNYKIDVKGDAVKRVTGQDYRKVEGDSVVVVNGTISYECPNYVQFNTPTVNMQDTLNVPIINVQMIHARPGSRGLGTVMDLKSRDAVHADWADAADYAVVASMLGGGSINRNPSAIIGGTWAGSNYTPDPNGFIPYVSQYMFSRLAIDVEDGTHDMNEDVIGDKISGVSGDVKKKINGDFHTDVGQDIKTRSAGIHDIEAGETITIKSDDRIFLEAKNGVALASGLMFKPIESMNQLPVPNASNEGMCIVFFNGKRLTTAYSNGSSWEIGE